MKRWMPMRRSDDMPVGGDGTRLVRRMGATRTIATGTARRFISRPMVIGWVAAAVDGAHFLDIPSRSVVIAMNDAGPFGASVLAAALPRHWARRLRLVEDVASGQRAVRSGLAAVVVDDPATAAEIAGSTQTPLVPIGITGGRAAMPPGHRLPVGGRPRVVARAGRPLGHAAGETTVTGSAVAAAVNRLLTEERLGWYGSMLADTAAAQPASSGAAHPDGVTEPGDGRRDSWRSQWRDVAPIDQRTRRAVWVTRR